jgi:hypothetical protein
MAAGRRSTLEFSRNLAKLLKLVVARRKLGMAYRFNFALILLLSSSIAKVHIGWGYIAQAFVIPLVVVVRHKLPHRLF